MKKLFPAIAVLILALTVTACTPAVQDEIPEAETTTVQKNDETDAITNATATDSQVSTTETSGAETEKVTPTGSHSMAQTTHTEKTHTQSPTTVKKETTTKKKVVTTKKTETTVAHSIKLPEYSPQPSAVGLFAEINKYRENNNLNKLTLDAELCKIAYVRAIEQNTLKGHDRPDGSKYYTILDDYNYNYSGCGENISFGKNVTVESTFDRWANSDAHNQNMLESRWTKAGIAMYRNTDNSYNIVILFAC